MVDANPHASTDLPLRPSTRPALTIRDIRFADVLYAIGDGLRDFRRAPAFGLAFGLFYAAFGWLLLALAFAFELDYYAFPMTTGFALVAPFVAAGCYEVSRRLEVGEPLAWSEVLSVLRRGGNNDLRWMVLVTVFSYIIWIDIAILLYVFFFGLNPLSLFELIEAAFSTARGAVFLLVGCGVGAVLAVIVFSVTAVSFPILFERPVDFVTAMITSVKAVLANRAAMIAWCAIIVGALGLSILSGFVALIVVLPVLGHATWHLYRRLIAPDNFEAP